MAKRWCPVLVAVTLVLVGCGSDDGDDDAVPSATSSETSSTDTTAGGSGSEAADTLSSEQICERLSLTSLGNDLGLDIVEATPDDSSTPQCAYDYVSDGGGISNLTVAAMRPEDVGGLGGTAAFDFVADINRSIAGDGMEEQSVSAGEDAVRITGSALHAGIVLVNDRVFVLIVPVGDAESDAVERAMSTMATALG